MQRQEDLLLLDIKESRLFERGINERFTGGWSFSRQPNAMLQELLDPGGSFQTGILELAAMDLSPSEFQALKQVSAVSYHHFHFSGLLLQCIFLEASSLMGRKS
jgi:hypothetical protein